MVWSLDTNPEWLFKKNENSQEQIRTNLRIFLKRPGQISGWKSFFQDTSVVLLQILLTLEFIFATYLCLDNNSWKIAGSQVQCGQIGGAYVRAKGAFSGSYWSLSCRGPYLTSGFDWAYSNFQTNVNQRGRLRPPPTNPFPTFLPFHWTMWYGVVCIGSPSDVPTTATIMTHHHSTQGGCAVSSSFILITLGTAAAWFDGYPKSTVFDKFCPCQLIKAIEEL